MTLDDLKVLVQDQASFRKAFRKTNTEAQRGKRLGVQEVIDNAGVKNELIELIANNFGIGRTPYIHQVVLPDGSQIRLKFHDTIKEVLNSKGKAVPGKESFLSYLEVTVMPIGAKGYTFTVDIQQCVWGVSKTKAREKHDANIADLVAQATELGIDLSSPTAWDRIYSESY